MYKVELSFDTSRLNEETVEQLCRQTDKLFEQEDLSCAERLHGKRVYVDSAYNAKIILIFQPLRFANCLINAETMNLHL